MRVPAVQQWGADRMSNYLSKKLKTEVSVDKFLINGFDDIQLRGVFIQDLEKDTLLYVRQLDANLDKPIQGLLNGLLKIEGLRLSDAYLNIQWLKDKNQNNLNELFKGPTGIIDSASYQIDTTQRIEFATEQKDQFYLLDQLELNNVRVRNFHEVKGKEEIFFIGKGELTDVEFDFKKTELKTEELWLENPSVEIRHFEYDEIRYRKLFVDPYAGFTGEFDDPFPITLTAAKLIVIGGKLKLDNYRNAPVKLTSEDQLDWDHIFVSDIEIDADSFYTNNWIFGAELNLLKAQTSSGFNIVNGEVGKIRVTEQRASLDNLLLESSMSTLQGDLTFIYKKYPDFRDFENKVRFDFYSDKSNIGINDLMTFSPALKSNPFFIDNYYESISLDGRILGYINNLRGRSLRLRIGDKLVVNGLVDVRDFTDPNKTRINFSLEELRTDMSTIRELVPNLELPNQFDKLGNLRLTGEFNGLLKDFIAFGELQTDLGSANFDMNLNFVRGVEYAVYDGKLNLINFDLGRWSGDDNLGIVNLSTSISKGRGLTKESASGQLSAIIRRFDYKGYSYNNANFSGFLEDELINGKFSITDENIDLSWEGKIDIDDSPHLDVFGDVKQLDLFALKLSDVPLYIQSRFNIDIKDLDPDKFTGEIRLNQVAIGRKLDSMVRVDSIDITSYYGMDSNKVFNINSSALTASIDGKFRVLSLPNYFINYFMKFNPSMASKLNLVAKENLPHASFNFDVAVKNSSGLMQFVAPNIDTIRDLVLTGNLNDELGFTMQGSTPSLKVDNAILQNVQLFASADGPYTNLVVSHDGMSIGKVNLAPLTVFADLEQDTMYYVLNEVDFESFVDQINIEGKIYVYEDLWQTQLYNSQLQIFGEDWAISDKNFLRFGADKLMVRNLDLSHNDEFIKIKSINDDKGIVVNLQDLPLSKINGLINYDKLNFDGLLSGAVNAPSLKSLDNLSANLVAPQLLINADSFGQFTLTANSDGPNQPVFVDLQMIKENQRLLGQAEVIVPNKKLGVKGHINSQLTIEQFPARIIEYFVTNGLSNTEGTFHGSITGVGPLSDPNILGDIFIPKSSFKIDILGTTYYIDKQKVHIDSELIDVSGVIITDKYGNEAQISGGLTHHNLAQLGFNAQLRSDEILILETTKDDNELYYGNCFAEVSAFFDGTVLKPVIYVNAENKPNSSFVINTDNDEKSGGLDFILFDFDTVSSIEGEGNVLTGVDLTIDMDVNRELEFQIILDESTRDIIRGSGNGDIIFKYSPAGEMSLFGEYVIDEGEYLFTYSVGGLVPVNKPFKIRRGSKLQWTDDPFDANVDIRADYTVVASPYNLISDQVGQVIADDAKRKTDVALELLLRGSMLQPDINFDIDFPELSGQLKSTVEIEVERLRSDQTAMQNQAASLILFRDFANSNLTAASSVNVVANTISEWLSNQVSYYLSGLVSQITSEVNFIDDIQFDIGYRLPSGEFSTVGAIETRSEVGIGTRIIMFDRRLEATIKGDYVNSEASSQGVPSTYFNTNFELDYLLTKDRRWRLRAYIINDQIQTGRRTRSGLGVAWKREYDDLDDYRDAIKEIRKKNRTNTSR